MQERNAEFKGAREHRAMAELGAGLNTEPIPVDDMAKAVLQGPAEELLQQVVAAALLG